MKNLIQNMILSASGWRKVFALSEDENDTTEEIGLNNEIISVYCGKVFAIYIKNKLNKKNPTIVLGMDTRPTGKAIAEKIIKSLLEENVIVKHIGIAAAPEIMAYAKSFDGFIYISASHNPIGHNGIKFGLNDGGVISGTENAKLVKDFEALCNNADAEKIAKKILDSCNKDDFEKVMSLIPSVKEESLFAYKAFAEKTIAPYETDNERQNFFTLLRSSLKAFPIGIVSDMNGSARCLSIDDKMYSQNNISFFPFNNTPGKIVHAIIPEPENLVHVAKRMEELHTNGEKNVILGYMPDCDGDRGNIVYWNELNQCSYVLKAQEVFSLSVLAELTFTLWHNTSKCPMAIAVNGPTSMRIDEIAHSLNAKTFRSEVGEANVVNLARKLRANGFEVRILGEGSNGGTITNPASVRDPLNTIFAFIKLLSIRDTKEKDGSVKPGLFHIWCNKINVEYNENFTLSDIIKTLPVYTTTGVSESRAILHMKKTNHAELKKAFQKEFLSSWENDKSGMRKKYGITSFKAVLTNGTEEKENVEDWSLSNKGGLKILFFENNSKAPSSFIWMRGSGTESAFRIMCDVKGNNAEKEKDLLEWETKLLALADGQN